ncbi:MAG: transglutaminase-like cysteine peptidase [Sulfurospirillaceae bacterium]|nr:transglutaminase-like cysteine peptidase [Sulfurospirillaceae bacterium]
MKQKILFFIFLLFSTLLATSSEFKVKEEILKKIEKEFNLFATKRVLALVKNMNEVRDGSDLEKLEKVNDFFNKVPYGKDVDIWGISDYWATRYEFIGKDKGDCEDYVIAKYFTLLELGVDSSKLFMSYVRSSKFDAAHMVLTYYETPKSIPLVLDNYNYKVLPATQRGDLTPIYSFDGKELFNAKQSRIGKLIPASTKQSRPWDELVITR